MSWRDALRPGSFRDVPFHVDGADQDGGRRQVVHEFAQRDDVFVEDLGRRPHEFRVDAYVLGDDYMAARDALIEACEAKGSGTLVHPYRGALTVSCLRYAVRESARDGGIAYFTLGFIASAAPVKASQTEDTAVRAQGAADVASTEAVAGFGQGFEVGGLPGFVAASAGERIAEFGDRMTSAFDRLGGARDALSAASLKLLSLRSDTLGLIYRAPDLGGQMFGLITSIRLLADTPRAALRELAGLVGYAPSGVVYETTPSRRAEAANSAAISRLVTLTAAAEAVAATAAITFESYDDAVAVRDDLAERLDDAALALADAGDDAGFTQLNALRLAMVRDVTTRGGSLARVYEYQPVATEPALVIAYRLYADAERGGEIVDRNRVAHPGFVAGGAPLEVLTDGG